MNKSAKVVLGRGLISLQPDPVAILLSFLICFA
jgi:hypothetical protein